MPYYTATATVKLVVTIEAASANDAHDVFNNEFSDIETGSQNIMVDMVDGFALKNLRRVKGE